jgi:hypothetical protein
MVLFYGGDMQIDAQRRDELISQQHQFECKWPAKEATPAQRATANQGRRPNPLDWSINAGPARLFTYMLSSGV